MSHFRIRIDDEVVFNGDLDAWQRTPPDRFRDMIRPDAKPQPWMKAIAIALADAALSGESASIEAITGPSYWSVEVTRI